MRRDILHIGLDVDDNFFTGAIFNSRTGKTEIFRVRPTIGALLKYLKKLQEKGKEFRICYEATYIGYSLCRELRKRGIECEVIAPSLIPVKPGKKVKTDKTDAINLSRYYSRGDLTIVNVPDEEDEAVRSLIRSRSFVVEERKRLKLHILSLCRVHNLNYKSESKRKNYWTPAMGNVDLPELNGEYLMPNNYCIGEVECALGVKLLDRIDKIIMVKKLYMLNILVNRQIQ